MRPLLERSGHNLHSTGHSVSSNSYGKSIETMKQ